jgi:dTDP-4-amino-4,6-dideoxygalactose transaminase
MYEYHGGWYMEMQQLGYNYRLSDIHAALGISQLSRAEAGVIKRKQIAERYDKAFAGTTIKTIVPSINVRHAFHLYIIQVEKRKELYDYLTANNIYTQVHYIPVHLMPYYKNMGWKKGDFPIAEKYYEHCLSLPMYPSLTEHEIEFVIEKILSFVNNYPS